MVDKKRIPLYAGSVPVISQARAPAPIRTWRLGLLPLLARSFLRLPQLARCVALSRLE